MTELCTFPTMLLIPNSFPIIMCIFFLNVPSGLWGCFCTWFLQYLIWLGLNMHLSQRDALLFSRRSGLQDLTKRGASLHGFHRPWQLSTTHFNLFFFHLFCTQDSFPVKPTQYSIWRLVQLILWLNLVKSSGPLIYTQFISSLYFVDPENFLLIMSFNSP